MSPLGMALVAAAVDSGTWRPPTLVTEPKERTTAKPHPLPPGHAEQLRQLLRQAVESGTAQVADLPGEQVYGTTGTATRSKGKPPHAWFVGFRGDLAFAVFVHGGGQGSDMGAPIAADFLRNLDPADVSARSIEAQAATPTS